MKCTKENMFVLNCDVIYVRIEAVIPFYAIGDGHTAYIMDGDHYLTVVDALEWCRKELPHDPSQAKSIATLERVSKFKNCNICQPDGTMRQATEKN
ncbi:MAG: hypothetical protein DRR06_13330 [Gammaproteobacteria bacterium]|nr:MAG: hypothetical protein DRR06_13330 [Gammaproteobacteria bacterium]